ncbi:MAG TPA: phospholipase D-like domain-containing protein [Ktedonobacteraceae bacterium]|nr:phospholipase D-like domain-containing protein [Ktedonobacteraceae bacterium]
MLTNEPKDIFSWWANNDTPIHTKDARVSYLIDGRSTLFALCCTFLKARSSIYLANWGMTAELELVRGKDHRAGSDGSPEQGALLALLRAEGLQEEAITFWCTHQLSVTAVLGYAIGRGVDVKILLWNSLPLPAYSHYHPRLTCKALSKVGATCLLDNSARGILHHPAESLHQKLAVIDNRWAFVGGIDPMVEKKSEFDRWDTSSHPFFTSLRQTAEGITPHPWHDVQALIEGSAAADVAYNFLQRWNAVVKRYERWQVLPKRRHYYQQLHVEPGETPRAVEQGTEIVQIARTIPRHTYHFQPKVVQGIAQLYLQAIRNAQRFIYLENQYLWVRAYTGLDIPFLGRDNREMELILQELIAALRRGVWVALVLPDHPTPGRAFSDASIARIRREVPEAVSEGHFQAFCLGTSIHQADGEHYRPVYVHAKIAIIDDLWTTAGSANLNNRGLRDDAEINVATFDSELARSLRLRLWAEHLGLFTDDELFALDLFRLQRPGPVRASVGIGNIWQCSKQLHALWKSATLSSWQNRQEILQDPTQGMQMMAQRAGENVQAYKARLPLQGHLVPYLLEDEARQQGLNFHEAHGWLEEEKRL